MKHITLGSNSFPAIGLGTYKLTGDEAIDIIRKALLLGYRHLDTAQLYDNESEIGQAVRESGVSRHEILISTKVWPSNLTVDRFLSSIEESLNKLKMDYTDLLLVHWPHHQLPVEEYIERFMQVQASGLVKEIGVSNFNVAQLKAVLATGAKIVTNQIEFHPWINQVKMQEFMLAHDLAITAYCPFGRGRFLHDKKLESIAAKHVRSPAQIILRWMMQKEKILAIPKASQLHRLEENLNVFDFELEQDDMEVIDAWRLENTRVVGVQAGAKWD